MRNVDIAVKKAILARGWIRANITNRQTRRVTITGTNFVSGATVSIGGTAATGVSVTNSMTITATTPAGTAGAASVVVTTVGGTATLSNGYTYIAPPNLVSSNPTTGPIAGGTSVTLTGTDFVAGATVTFDGFAATSVTVVSSTTITATTPADASGPADIIVTNPDGQNDSIVAGFTYIAPPNVVSISPTSGTVDGGTAVTITGTDFVVGATVTIGGIATTSVSVVNSTTITAKTPAHAAGTVDVVVTNPATQSNTLMGGFTFVGILAITAQPADFSYSATLTGDPVTRTASFAVGVNDSTGGGAGWNLQASTGPLTKEADTIPAANHTITSATATGATGTTPTNSVVYPLPLPTSAGKIYNAATNTGTGQATVTLNTQLVVPADTAAGTYAATLTVTIAAGP